MKSWLEFVEDADGRGSAARFNMVVGVLVGSIVVVWMALTDKLGWEIFTAFMGATGGVYSIGKWRESVVETEQIKADSPNPPPTVVVPPAPLGPTTVIQVGPDGKNGKPKKGKTNV